MRLRLKPLGRVCGLAILLCAGQAISARGAIIVSSTAPTGAAAAIAQPNGGNDIRDPFYTSAGNRRAVGTTFAVNPGESPFTLNAITMKLHVGAAADTPIVGSSWVASVFTLAGDNDTTPDAYLNAAGDKRTAVGTLPALTFNADNYVTFVLPFDVNIASGQQYGFMVDFASANANNAISGSGTGWVGSSSNERGNTFGLVQSTNEDSYTLWSAGGDDIEFWLGHVTPVPEPSAFVLASLGLISLIGYFRRRHRA